MDWRILDTSHGGPWCEALHRFLETDIYFQPQYHRAYELNGDGEAFAFVAEQGGDILFHPFLVRPINKVGRKKVSPTKYDIESVYGYSGPLSTTSNPVFLGNAWEAFSRWCGEQNIVAEFIRFHPLLQNHRYAGDTCEVIQDRETVALPLDCSEEELWAGYSHVHRNHVRKALKSGLVGEETAPQQALGAFKPIYHDTMDRVGAGNYYHFPDAYFDDMIREFGDQVRFFSVHDGARVAAAALFLTHGALMHYHLAASDIRYSPCAPTNLLVHTAALWGLRHGFKWLHLGGGRTPDVDDSLFGFKASISKSRLPFHTGRRIHDPPAYSELCSMWMDQKRQAQHPSYFLAYRLDGDQVGGPTAFRNSDDNLEEPDGDLGDRPVGLR